MVKDCGKDPRQWHRQTGCASKVTGERESEGERDREKIRKRELDAFQIATPHIVTGGAIV